MTNSFMIERIAKSINGPHDSSHIGQENLEILQDHRWDKATTEQDRGYARCQAESIAAIIEDKEKAARRSGEWDGLDKVLNWINSQESVTFTRKTLYKEIMQMRPADD